MKEIVHHSYHMETAQVKAKNPIVKSEKKDSMNSIFELNMLHSYLSDKRDKASRKPVYVAFLSKLLTGSTPFKLKGATNPFKGKH